MTVYTNFFGGAFFGGGFFGGGTEPGGGGIPSQGYQGHEVRHRTKEDVRKDREKFGVIPQQVILDVARRQVERLELDKQKQFEELSRELKLNKLEWEGKYLESLNETRERLITLEIGMRLHKRIQEESDLIMLMLLAANI